MLYADWINAVCDLLEYQANIVDPTSALPTDSDAFNLIYPRAIEYTELRLQRDLDFIATTTVVTGAMTANSRTVALPVSAQGPFVVVSQVRPLLNGDRQQPLEPVSRTALDFFWPSDQSPGAGILPSQWTPNDEATILVGPAPDIAYGIEILGTTRFLPLSASNTSNFLTFYVPDLYIAASMIFFSGFQRDFGSQSDDPKMAQSWENQYQLLLQSAVVEEARKRYADMFPHSTDPSPVTG